MKKVSAPITGFDKSVERFAKHQRTKSAQKEIREKAERGERYTKAQLDRIEPPSFLRRVQAKQA